MYNSIYYVRMQIYFFSSVVVGNRSFVLRIKVRRSFMQPSRVSFCTYYSLKCLFIFIIHYSFKNLSGFAGLFRGPRRGWETSPTGSRVKTRRKHGKLNSPTDVTPTGLDCYITVFLHRCRPYGAKEGKNTCCCRPYGA